jgi:SAM-dependent methyltransferase
MNLETERMSNAGHPRPEPGKGFGGLYQDGFYINFLHGLDFLCRKHITKNTRVLELGCFYGTSAELFRQYTDFLTCVDLEQYPEMVEVINKYNISFFKTDSVSFLKGIEKGSFDLIYIDTSHDYYTTMEELKWSFNNTINGQIIAGHDYNTPGVYNAIRATFLYPDIEIYLDSSWCIKKTDSLKLINQ